LGVLALGWEEEEAGFLCSSLRFFLSLPRSFPFLSPFSLLFFFSLFLFLSFFFFFFSFLECFSFGEEEEEEEEETFCG
jgi:hypothetical protein